MLGKEKDLSIHYIRMLYCYESMFEARNNQFTLSQLSQLNMSTQSLAATMSGHLQHRSYPIVAVGPHEAYSSPLRQYQFVKCTFHVLMSIHGGFQYLPQLLKLGLVERTKDGDRP